MQNSSHIESQTLQGCSEIFYEFSFFQLISLPRTSNSVKVIQRTFVHLHSRQAASKSKLVHKIIINGIMWHGSLPLEATKFDTFISIFTIKNRNFQFSKGSQIGVTIIISPEIEIKIFHCFLVILTTIQTALGTIWGAQKLILRVSRQEAVGSLSNGTLPSSLPSMVSVSNSLSSG